MKHPPLSQQITALQLAQGRPYFAFFMEQGTGKAYVGLAEAEQLFLENKIDCLIVIAPNGVQRNWLDREAPKHLSLPYATLLWTGNHTEKYKKTAINFVRFASGQCDIVDRSLLMLPIIGFNIEAFSKKKSKAETFLTNLLKRLRCLVDLDESSMIKNGTAQCTKAMLRCSQAMPFKRLMTGTPVTQSPLNFFTQMKFLRDGLLGFTEFMPFKAYYAEWRQRVVMDKNPKAAPGATRSFSELVRYRNLSVLKARVDAHSFTILKKDCLDLPEKVYEPRLVEMSTQQADLYLRAKKELIIDLDAGKLTIAHAFTRLTRLRQILGGFVKFDEESAAQPIGGSNPKINSMLQFIEELDAQRKVIIWAEFKPELLAIEKALSPGKCAMYHGDVRDEERHENIDRFMDDGACRFFVGNPKTGKYGLTLTIASNILYYSNGYSAEARWQSEDRAHRIGQDRTCLYTDLIVPGTIDEKIMNTLSKRKSIADVFKGSPQAMARWLEADVETVEDFDNRGMRRI